jgi:homospermidine synthase
VYWYGSRLTIGEARELAPYNNATSLQVVAGISGRHGVGTAQPDAGVVEPDDLDHRVVLEAACPTSARWSASMAPGRRSRTAVRSSTTRPTTQDPWQFINFRVA